MQFLQLAGFLGSPLHTTPDQVPTLTPLTIPDPVHAMNAKPNSPLDTPDPVHAKTNPTPVTPDLVHAKPNPPLATPDPDIQQAESECGKGSVLTVTKSSLCGHNPAKLTTICLVVLLIWIMVVFIVHLDKKVSTYINVLIGILLHLGHLGTST